MTRTIVIALLLAPVLYAGDEEGPKAQPPRPDKGARILERKDTDGDGKLSAAEFGRDEAAFKRADRNGDGFVDAAEFRAMSGGRHRPPMPPMTGEQLRAHAKQIMERLDKNGDGKLGKDELPKQVAGGGPRRGGPDLAHADTNKDGFVDLLELVVALEEAGAGRGGKRGRRRGPGMLKQLMERFDADKDGRVTKEEWKGRPEIFVRLDANKDGAITKDEVEKAMQRMAHWRGRSADAMLRRWDSDKDGAISREEWRLDRAFFDRFDRNKDGVLRADELVVFGRGRRGRKSPMTLGRFLKEFDKNGDGKVARDECRDERRFAEMDADGDGVLSRAEIEDALDKRQSERGIGFHERFDRDGDGKVTRAEFTGPAGLFEKKDRNGDGVIDANDERRKHEGTKDTK
ncbi:MAG: EF-hand domain-containing protein [Planctomycetota bacterium]|jgi:Ca2+-binding EF-hand superfamily protein